MGFFQLAAIILLNNRCARTLSFSFLPDIDFFFTFPVLLKVCMIAEIVVLGTANIFDILLTLFPDVKSLQTASLVSLER